MTNLESPKWFQDALEQKPESHSIEVDGANISYLTWGKKENPGILFCPWWNGSCSLVEFYSTFFC